MTVAIDAILFDMGGTLWRSSPQPIQETLRITGQMLELLGVNTDPLGFHRTLLNRARAYKKWSEETLVELSEGELWTRWMLPDKPEGQIKPIAIQLNQLWRESYGRRKLRPEAQQTLLSLFRRGYRLGLVSNTTSSVEVPKVFNELELSGCFETIILSCDVGKRKPGPAILLEAVERMGVLPGRCAYVGDRPDRDVASAKAAGFSQTIILRNQRKLEALTAEPSLAPDAIISNLKGLLPLFPALRRAHKAAEITLYDAALSSMWGIRKFAHLEDFFIAASRLGFERIELNHMVDPAMLKGFRLSDYPIGSIHEPCPAVIPEEELKIRDLLISSPDEEHRMEGVNSIRRSIDLARELGVRSVIVHAGMIQFDPAAEKRLIGLYKAGSSGTPEFEEIKAGMIKSRSERIGPCLEAVHRSMAELLDYAGPMGVRLGLENRYHYFDIPTPDEMTVLLELADPERLGFIYDSGHGNALERLGFFRQLEWLERFSGRMIGTHLHDAIGIQDHQPPGTGEIDFGMVSKYLPDTAFRTLEIHPRHSFEQVRKGLSFLVEMGCIKRSIKE